jgi:predicted 3-demethylubiquinone-9 3-methyltransferase (glyoxalase superfamily)
MARAIATILMFDGTAEQAMNLYVSLFRGSEVTSVERYGPAEHGVEGSIKRAGFTLGGQSMICFDSTVKHGFSFTPSMSLYVDCESAEEQESAFSELASGGTVLMPLGHYGFSEKFAWVSDRFGVSWQLNLS